MSTKEVSDIGEINALLSRGTEYEGKLVFEGRVRIDGKFKGSIVSSDLLIIGEGAEIDAKIEIGTLIMRGGTLVGEVHAQKLVELHAACKVQGTIYAPQIFVDRGAQFQGQCYTQEGSSEIFSLDNEQPMPEWLSTIKPDPEKPKRRGKARQTAASRSTVKS